jgi:hypothetical protein
MIAQSVFYLPSTASAAPSGTSGSIILGSSNYLKTADSSDFVMGSNDFTFETWVYATASPSTSFTGIVSIGMPSDLTSGTNGHEIRIGQSFAGDNKLGFMAPNSASNADVWTPTNSALALGVWTHLALVRDGTTLTLYVNGVSAATRTSVDFVHTGYSTKSNIGAFFVSKNDDPLLVLWYTMVSPSSQLINMLLLIAIDVHIVFGLFSNSVPMIKTL